MSDRFSDTLVQRVHVLCAHCAVLCYYMGLWCGRTKGSHQAKEVQWKFFRITICTLQLHHTTLQSEAVLPLLLTTYTGMLAIQINMMADIKYSLISITGLSNKRGFLMEFFIDEGNPGHYKPCGHFISTDISWQIYWTTQESSIQYINSRRIGFYIGR